MTYEWMLIGAIVVLLAVVVVVLFFRRKHGQKPAPQTPTTPVTPPETLTPPETCTVPPDRVGNVLKGVYHPQRLAVLADCAVAKGTITKVTQEPDGDYHIRLKLDPTYEPLLQQGQTELVVEVIPADQGTVQIPKEGDHITVNGPWVWDSIHNWREVHPAWMIVVG